jgi:hypothetical protein
MTYSGNQDEFVELIALLPLGEGLGMRAYGAPIFLNQFAVLKTSVAAHQALTQPSPKGRGLSCLICQYIQCPWIHSC